MKCWGETVSASELLELMNTIDPAFLHAVRELQADAAINPEDIGLTGFGNLDTGLTDLVQLVYISCWGGKVHIPNQEVAEEFLNTLTQAKNSPANKTKPVS